jgi:hypothetical protein
MTNKFLPALLPALLLVSLLISCIKERTGDTNSGGCDQLALLHTRTFAAVTRGDAIQLAVAGAPDVYYQWSGPGNFQSNSQNPLVTSNAYYWHRGWYYVSMSLQTCSPSFDSVYVEVKFPQGVPACTLTNNTGTFGGAVVLGDQSYSYVSFGPGIGGYEIEGNSSNGDLRITMSSYWTTHPLEDGIYYTTNDPLPDESEIDEVNIADVNQNIYWVAEGGKPVYISHVDGKARISFCNISFSGDWGGNLYHTTVSAQVSQQ